MSKEIDTRIKENSVVQLNENAQDGWRGCLAQVDEVRSWGVQCWIQIPMQGSAYLRPTWDQIDYIGEAVLSPTKTPLP